MLLLGFHRFDVCSSRSVALMVPWPGGEANDLTILTTGVTCDWKSLSISSSITAKMEIIIESAREADIPRLTEIYSCQELHRSVNQAGWYVRSYLDYNSILVARVNGRIQGSCFWRIEGEKVGGTGWIEDVWVEKEFRRLGLAERLLTRAIADLKVHFSKDGIVLRKIFLTTHVTNIPAKGLYEKVGFVECGTVEGMYEDGVVTLIYGIDVREDREQVSSGRDSDAQRPNVAEDCPSGH